MPAIAFAKRMYRTPACGVGACVREGGDAGALTRRGLHALRWLLALTPPHLLPRCKRGAAPHASAPRSRGFKRASHFSNGRAAHRGSSRGRTRRTSARRRGRAFQTRVTLFKRGGPRTGVLLEDGLDVRRERARLLVGEPREVVLHRLAVRQRVAKVLVRRLPPACLRVSDKSPSSPKGWSEVCHLHACVLLIKALRCKVLV